MKRVSVSMLTQRSFWELPKQPSSIAPDYVWTNADQDPVPPERRTWTGWSFVWYWFSDLVTIAGCAVLITFCAAFCNAIPTVLNGAIGANLHIPFPIAVRASYGYWFSYWCVFSRAVLALFWFGVQSAYGANCVTQMITAMAPGYRTIQNGLPESAGITTQGMISYFIYGIIQFPFMMIPTHKLQYMFWLKTVLVTPTALAMVIWISVRARSGREFFNQPASVHGSERAWLWVSSLTSITGGFSTIAVNIPDFSRFSKKPGGQVWQLPAIPFFKCIVGVLGVVSASASKQLWGEVLWEPLGIIDTWQTSSGGRAAAFFASAVWLLAQICVNISANSISFANDITSLAPRWFNIRRGVIFAALMGGWAMCPWVIIASADALLSFLSAYALFFGPMVGILVTDYWLVKRRRYDVPALYDSRGIYFYKYGTNWRALVTTLVIIAPLLPGMANKVSPNTVNVAIGLQHLFSFNWLYGFCMSITIYLTLNLVLPDRKTLIPESVYGSPPMIEGLAVETDSERLSEHGRPTKPSMEVSGAKEIGLVGST